VATFIDNTAKVLAGLVQQNDDRLKAAALLLQAEHKRDLSTANPAPHRNSSRPGEYPKARTYNLRDAVAVERVQKGVEWRVGYLKNADYIVALTRNLRKNVFDTARRVQSRIAKILNGG
jgi:hypothetical protein